METFIKEITGSIFKDYKDDLSKVEVIFPNRRAGLYFRKELGELIDKPIWMPRISSLEDFIYGRSNLVKIEKLEAVFYLYEVYKSHHPSAESFDKFFFWGEMILRDFEEVDHYLVNSDQLFSTIVSQKELDEEFFYLDDDSRKIIQEFWATFLPDSSGFQSSFLKTWGILNQVYKDFKALLLSKGKAYNGLVYRSLLESGLQNDEPDDRSYIFAGFNALTLTEEAIIRLFVRNKGASMIWDVDPYYMGNSLQESGYFLRKYRNDKDFGRFFSVPETSQITKKKEVTLTGVSLEVGQTKILAEELQKLASKNDFVPEKTAIVLAHEYMLFPVLHALPENINKVNVTMGYPLKDSTAYSLMESVLRLQNSKQENLVLGLSFYYLPLVEIMEHPLIQPLVGKNVMEFVGEIRRRNLIRIYSDDLPKGNTLLDIIFSSPESPLNYLMDILENLHHELKESWNELEREILIQFHEQITKFDQLLTNRSEYLSYDFLIKIIRRIASSVKVPFSGEPLNGVQIMGVLETRNLDFENVFILNLNEDSWPAPSKSGSFIPYNIRRAFEMPVHEHQEAIYSYLFYRLFQRSSSVSAYYNTVSEFNVNGELSRLAQQLIKESALEIQMKILANPIKISSPKKISIEKTEDVLEKLNRFLVRKGEWTPRLTPSALDTYLNCRLRFYFKYVQEMYEPDELQEDMSPMVFGNILHDTMEILYDQFRKKQKTDIITSNDFFWLEGGVDGAINKAFIKHYNVKNEKKFKLEGRNIIAAEMVRKTAIKILKFDQRYAPFKILGLEASTRDGYTIDFPVKNSTGAFTVGIKGKTDRIDLKQGKVRVIDYKTGRDERDFESVESLIDRDDKKRNKAVFQVFFYSYLFYKTSSENYDQIEPGLYNSRDLFDKEFSWQILHKTGADQIQVTDFRKYEAEFQEVVSTVIHEIWDPSIDFSQVTDHSKCKFCPYKEICGRDFK